LIFYFKDNMFLLVNASQSRVQQVALTMLRAPVFSFAPLKQLSRSRNWALVTMVHLCDTLSEFKSLLTPKVKVKKITFNY
jgi:hypothetical protein